MPPESPSSSPTKLNRLGMLGGIAGIVMSLGAAVIESGIAALAFGHSTQAGIGAAGLAAVAVTGVACGLAAILRSLKGRPAGPLIAGSIIAAVMSALACFVLII